MKLGEVEVTYALPERQWLLRVPLHQGDSLQAVVERSGLIEAAGLSGQALRYGVFGRLREPHEAAQAGDRIELYRPLLADPKDARRERASKRRGG